MTAQVTQTPPQAPPTPAHAAAAAPPAGRMRRG